MTTLLMAEIKSERAYNHVGLIQHDAIKLEVFLGSISFSLFFVLENVDDLKFNTFWGEEGNGQ